MRLWRENSGQILAVTAVCLSLLLGVLAIAVDVGQLLFVRRQMQAQADAAALAGAMEISKCAGTANCSTLTTAAYSAATKDAGLTITQAVNCAAPAASGITVAVNNPPCALGASDPHNGSNSYVEAVVTTQQPTFFGGFLGFSKLPISARGEAGIPPSTMQNCACILGSSGETLNMSNDAQFNEGSGCQVTVNSTSSNAVAAVGSAGICSGSLGIASTTWTKAANVSGGGNICAGDTVTTGASPCSTTTPNVPPVTNCSADPYTLLSGGGNNYTVGPGSSYGTTTSTNGISTVCYNALTINGNGNTATLNPGIYVIKGGTLNFNSGGPNLGGNGVVFYLTGGANLVITNGANVNLVAGGNLESNGTTTAPSTGIYNGIVIYQDPGYPSAANDSTTDTGDSSLITVQGGSNVYMSGEILAPLAPMTLGNGSGTFNTGLVVQSLTMNGGSALGTGANVSVTSAATGTPLLVQ
jgi:Flp pilus assembly protein TadG